MTLLVAGTAGVLAAVLLGAASGSPRTPDSGVRGLVLYGPTCPVQRPGQSCVRPYRAVITVRRQPAGTVAARVRSGADGRFTVRLPVGCYRLEPRNEKPFPRARTQTHCVRRHHFTTLTIRFDSGIR